MGFVISFLDRHSVKVLFILDIQRLLFFSILVLTNNQISGLLLSPPSHNLPLGHKNGIKKYIIPRFLYCPNFCLKYFSIVIICLLTVFLLVPLFIYSSFSKVLYSKQYLQGFCLPANARPLFQQVMCMYCSWDLGNNVQCCQTSG